MKLTTFIAVFALGAATANAAAIPASAPKNSISGLLGKFMRRAGTSDPAPEADTDDREWETVMRRARWCHRFGEPCWKRDATSDPPETGFCHRVGEPCWKVKRAAEAMAAAIAESEEEAESKPVDAEANDVERRVDRGWCHRVGEPCWKAKRDLKLLQMVQDEWKEL